MINLNEREPAPAPVTPGPIPPPPVQSPWGQPGAGSGQVGGPIIISK